MLNRKEYMGKNTKIYLMIRVIKYPSYYGCDRCSHQDLYIKEVIEGPHRHNTILFYGCDIPITSFKHDLIFRYFCPTCKHEGEFLIPASRLEDFEIEWRIDIVKSDLEKFIDQQKVSPCKHHKGSHDCGVFDGIWVFKCPFKADPEQCDLLKRIFEISHEGIKGTMGNR